MKRELLLCLLLGVLLWCTPAYAQNVSVQVPTFPVELNDVAYDNQRANYPLLVYQDITYFPMTYRMTRSMGLITAWDNTKGLYIAQHDEGLYPEDEKMNGKNKLGGKYTASIADYPIKVNSWSIDNSKESYPLLNFRGVTYFPLSWRYAHDAFGWDIKWDAKIGLQVRSYRDLADSYCTLIQVNQTNALFLEQITDYEKYTTESGEIGYTRIGVRDYAYRLNYAEDTLQKVSDTKKEITWQQDISENVSEEFSLNDRQLCYKGAVIVQEIPEECLDHPRVSVQRFVADSGDLLQVTIPYTEIPAPYTPYVRYVFLESGGTVKEMTQWDGDSAVRRFYETKTTYYVCSHARNVIGRFYNSLCTIMKVDKASGKETILNDLYSQYGSLEAIGMADDKLYVRAIYFGDEDDLHRIEYDGKVNLFQDGYFYIDSDDKLHKVHDYVDGEAFLTPNGKLYVYNSDTLQVINLTDHKKVTRLAD